MRLAAQIKSGYYPAKSDLIDWVCEILAFPETGTTMFDPCAGDGAALDQFMMNAPGSIPYTVELDDARAALCQQRFGDLGQHLCSDFLSTTQCMSESFGFIWCNPPYDDEFGGGGRQEMSFFSRAMYMLASEGVIAVLAPTGVLSRYNTTIDNYRDQFARLDRFIVPKELQQYGEVLLVGKKLKGNVKQSSKYLFSEDIFGHWKYADKLSASAVPPYEVPFVDAIPRLRKTGKTPLEISKAFAASPLRTIFEAPPEIELSRPPMSLGLGHIGLLLPCGRLNGVVDPGNGELPHVVRGVARKISVVTDTTEERDKSQVKTTTVKTEQIQLIVRVATADGRLVTMTSGNQESESQDV